MQEYQPDVVVLQVDRFWYAYESTPLWFERRPGRAGKQLSSMRLAAAKTAWFASLASPAPRPRTGRIRAREVHLGSVVQLRTVYTPLPG